VAVQVQGLKSLQTSNRYHKSNQCYFELPTSFSELILSVSGQSTDIWWHGVLLAAFNVLMCSFKEFVRDAMNVDPAESENQRRPGVEALNYSYNSFKK